MGRTLRRGWGYPYFRSGRGRGSAALNADGSNRAAAETSALTDAMADAKTQASAIAAAARAAGMPPPKASSGRATVPPVALPCLATVHSLPLA